MGGALAVFQVAGCQGEGLERSSPAGEGDAAAGVQVGEDFDDGADAGAAQHGSARVAGGADAGGDVGVPVRRMGASAMVSQRLASSARAGPKRKERERGGAVCPRSRS